MLQYISILLEAHRARTDERGASAVEYGLLVAGIAVAVIAAVVLVGQGIFDLFDSTSTSINVPPTTPGP
jgi:pilus assembly protein Flp/PilA